jgi:hypothetical protein
MQRALKGALAGAIAWSAMDSVLRFLYNQEDPDTRRQEDEARGGVPALENMAERMAEIAGITLSSVERQRGGTFLQWVVGIGAGMLYSALRDHLPGSGIRRGLLYGAAFSLLVDEGIIPLLKFAPGPFAFPWQTHARGFAAHLVYGAVAESSMAWLDRIDEHVDAT